jgi:hypothetical protein
MNDVTDAQSFLEKIDIIIEKKINKILQENGCLKREVAKIASIDTSHNTATVYLPPTYDIASTVPYPNRTGLILGSTLNIGDWVYLFTIFNTPDQGWILIKK